MWGMGMPNTVTVAYNMTLKTYSIMLKVQSVYNNTYLWHSTCRSTSFYNLKHFIGIFNTKLACNNIVIL